MTSAISDVASGPAPLLDRLPEAWWFLRGLGCGPDLADDLCQDAAVLVLRGKLDGVSHADRLRYLLTVAKNLFLQHLRAEGRRRESLDVEAIDAEWRPIWSRANEVDPIAALRSCLDELPARDRRVVRERYLHKSPRSAIAAQDGLSPEAVTKLLQRAKRRLRSCLMRRLATAGLDTNGVTRMGTETEQNMDSMMDVMIEAALSGETGRARLAARLAQGTRDRRTHRHDRLRSPTGRGVQVWIALAAAAVVACAVLLTRPPADTAPAQSIADRFEFVDVWSEEELARLDPKTEAIHIRGAFFSGTGPLRARSLDRLKRLRKLRALVLSDGPELENDALGRLPAGLEHLEIRFCGFDETCLAILSTAVPTLQSLDLGFSGIKIDGKALAAICKLDQLRSLRLGFHVELMRMLAAGAGSDPESPLTDGDLAHLLRLPMLQEIDLTGHGRLTAAGIRESLARLPRLEHVAYCCDNITPRDLAVFDSMQSLSSLRLSPSVTDVRTGLQGAKQNDLIGLGRLRELSLDGNPLSASEVVTLAFALRLSSSQTRKPAAGKRGSGLQHLSLRGSRIDDDALEALGRIHTLRSLRVGSFGTDLRLDVSATGLSKLQGLPSLEELELRDVECGPSGFGALRRCSALRKLWLSGCSELDDACIAALLGSGSGLTHLKLIEVPPGKLTPSAFGSLRKHCPKLESLEVVVPGKGGDKVLGILSNMSSLRRLILVDRQGSPTQNEILKGTADLYRNFSEGRLRDLRKRLPRCRVLVRSRSGMLVDK